MDITDLLKNLDKNLVNEETANAIADAFKQAVEQKAKAHTELAVEKALLEQDEDHAQKLQDILEKTDIDHTNKLKLVIKTISENHTNKLAKIVNLYKKSVDDKAKLFSEKIITDLDTFLTKYLENKIPYTQIKEAVENTHARKQLEKIRELVGFDPSLVNENVKSVVKEGRTKFEQLNQQLNEAYEKNTRLSQELQKTQTALVLEGKTKGMPKSKKEFVVKLLEDKSINYIKENFNYVVEMFENGEQEETVEVAKEANKAAVSRNVNVPKQLVSESVSGEAKNTPVNEYLSELERIG
jgi:hypothetical protein